MFAHQVIEDLKNIVIKQDFKYTNMCHEIIPFIVKSQKMHIKEADNVVYLRKNTIGKERLFVDNHEYMKLPYTAFYLDYVFKNRDISKAAILALDAGDVIRIHQMYYSPEMRSWMLHPLFYNVKVGVGAKVGKMIDMSDPEMEIIIRKDQEDLSILHCTLLLLNCKNITTQEHRPDEALNRARRKRGRVELFTYKTLKLSLPAGKQGKRPKGEPTGEHNRIHFCRGHFKEYTADAPLFGRITGLWWWQPHVRGRNRDGIVMKDYEVKAKGQGVVHEMV